MCAIEDLQKERAERQAMLAEALQREEVEAGATFRPQINANSRRLASRSARAHVRCIRVVNSSETLVSY